MPKKCGKFFPYFFVFFYPLGPRGPPGDPQDMPSASRPFFSWLFHPRGPREKNILYFFIKIYKKNMKILKKNVGSQGFPGMRLGDSAKKKGEHFFSFSFISRSWSL